MRILLGWNIPFSFADVTGRIETSRSQQGALAELSPQIRNMRKSFAKVLGHPAIVITLEDYNLALKIMKTGPIGPR